MTSRLKHGCTSTALERNMTFVSCCKDRSVLVSCRIWAIDREPLRLYPTIEISVWSSLFWSHTRADLFQYLRECRLVDFDELLEKISGCFLVHQEIDLPVAS